MRTILHNKYVVLLTAFLIGSSITVAQEVTEEWAVDYDLGVTRIDIPYSIGVDDEGNTFVTGESNSANTNIDYYTIKYAPDGAELAAHRYDRGTNQDDRANELVIDGDGNVYVTGESWGGATNWDFVTIKYNSNLDTLWTRTYDAGISNEERTPKMTIDDQGNVYVSGPSVGAGTSWDYAIIKYAPNGDQLWASRYNSTTSTQDIPADIGVDSEGNVYVTGKSIGNGWDYITVKYDSDGEFEWEERYNHANDNDEPVALVVDGDDNVIVTGSSVGGGTGWDYATIKYADNGGTEWVQRYNGPPSNNQDFALAMAVDASNNIYVTGSSVSNDTGYDYATVKYEPVDGDQQWVSRYDQAFGEDWATAIVVDDMSNIYVTGRSVGSGTSWDYATIKYEPEDGDEIWAERFNRAPPGNNEDRANGITVDDSNNVFVTGQSVGVGSSWDYVTIRYSQPSTVAVETIDSVSEFNVFPNPTSGHCTIALGKSYPEIKVRVMNYLGMEVERSTFFNENQIELNLDVPAGIYYIEMITDRRSTLKVLKN